MKIFAGASLLWSAGRLRAAFNTCPIEIDVSVATREESGAKTRTHSKALRAK
jgi:hypothetical protein